MLYDCSLQCQGSYWLEITSIVIYYRKVFIRLAPESKPIRVNRQCLLWLRHWWYRGLSSWSWDRCHKTFFDVNSTAVRLCLHISKFSIMRYFDLEFFCTLLPKQYFLARVDRYIFIDSIETKILWIWSSLIISWCKNYRCTDSAFDCT